MICRPRSAVCGLSIFVGYLPCRKRWPRATRWRGRSRPASSRLWFPATLAFTRHLPRRDAPRRPRGSPRSTTASVPSTSVAARRNLAVILGAPEDCARGAAARPSRWSSRTSTPGWIFMHFATRPPEEAARMVEGVVGYSRIVEGRLVRQGRPAPDRPPRQLGGRRPDARAGQPADPRRPRAGHVPGRRARAAPPARALAAFRRSAWTAASCRRSRCCARSARTASWRCRGIATSTTPASPSRSSAARPSSRAGRCGWRWRRARSSCPPSSCVCRTGATGRSSRSRCRSTPDGRP